ncbi:MAG: Gfo/Idh/MocA family oxidoreductase [Planctomycetes bacterium]|nr:Gfo/Idh/MocA family oxidoreductase [Planctomycetota bacterium]
MTPWRTCLPRRLPRRDRRRATEISIVSTQPRWRVLMRWAGKRFRPTSSATQGLAGRWSWKALRAARRWRSRSLRPSPRPGRPPLRIPHSSLHNAQNGSCASSSKRRTRRLYSIIWRTRDKRPSCRSGWAGKAATFSSRRRSARRRRVPLTAVGEQIGMSGGRTGCVPSCRRGPQRRSRPPGGRPDRWRTRLTMRKVKLALLGCGSMGQRVHLPSFLASQKCEVVALADVRMGVARQVAARYGIPKVYGSHEELVTDPEIEAVAAITLWSDTPRVATCLLRAGKHVFVEKPMALSVAEAEPMVQAAREAQRLLMIAYPLRFDAGVQRAKQLLEQCRASGELGKIIWAHAQLIGGEWTAGFFQSAPPLVESDERKPATPPQVPSFIPPDLRGKYVFFAQACAHNVNMVRMLLGDELQVSYANFDKSVCSVVLDGGSYLAALHTGIVMPRPPWWDESMTVAFEKGWLRVEPPPRLLPNVSARVTCFRGDTQQTLVEDGPPQWAFRREAEHFLDCVLTGKETLSPGSEALRDVALTEAIFRQHLQRLQCQ